MTLNELRIGNWVQIDDLPSERVTLNMLSVLKIVPATLSKFNPIELTVTVLVKCGFNGELGFGEFKGVRSRGIISVNFENNGFQIDVNQDVKYLHQLQNLYFAINGKELEVEL